MASPCCHGNGQPAARALHLSLLESWTWICWCWSSWDVALFLLGWGLAPWWWEVSACPVAAGVGDMGGISTRPM